MDVGMWVRWLLLWELKNCDCVNYEEIRQELLQLRTTICNWFNAWHLGHSHKIFLTILRLLFHTSTTSSVLVETEVYSDRFCLESNCTTLAHGNSSHQQKYLQISLVHSGSLTKNFSKVINIWPRFIIETQITKIKFWSCLERNQRELAYQNVFILFHKHLF